MCNNSEIVIHITEIAWRKLYQSDVSSFEPRVVTSSSGPFFDDELVMLLTAGLRTALVAAILLALPMTGIAHDGAHKEWLKSLMRPDNHRYPERGHDRKSLFCCGEADVVKTKFKVENTGGPYPEDQWYAWLHEAWTLIPPEKILPEYAPNGEAFLFVLAGTIQCFVRPKGGL
jgi:hypothetical protein